MERQALSNDGATFSGNGVRPLFGSDLLSGIVATVSDFAIITEPSGHIRTAMSNPDNRSFDDLAKWPGRNLSELVDAESFTKFRNRLDQIAAQAAQGETAIYRWAELMHLADGGAYPVRYSIHWLASEGAVLMLGQDQRPIMEIQQQLLNAQIALERDYEAQREIDTRYRLLMESTRDAFVLVAVHTGRIIDLNHNAAALLGAAREDCKDVSFAQEFSGRSTAELMTALRAAVPAAHPAPVEVETRRNQRRLLIHARLFRAAGEQLVLCRIEDPAEEAPGSGQLGANLRQLYYRGVDAIVFTNKDGIIQFASEAFLNLTDSPNLAAVRGRSIGDFLARGAVDLKVLLESVRRAGHLRMYATKLTTDFDAQVSVEVSGTWLDDRADPTLALVIRDAGSLATMRSDLSVGEDNIRGIMELVGASTLKDIVAESTNVVEKICIETAIELTRNNRVAAAEMLGLSRQSLYVKLRKYGLLSRSEE